MHTRAYLKPIKPYKLGIIARKVFERNTQDGVHPEKFRLGEDREAYLRRVS